MEGGGDFRNYHDNWTGRGINKDGGLVGGVLGYNWQMGNFVVGLEGDAAALLSGNEAWTYNGVQVYNNTVNGDYAAAIRGRVGITAFDRALLYVAGGVAFGDVKYNYAPANVPLRPRHLRHAGSRRLDHRRRRGLRLHPELDRAHRISLRRSRQRSDYTYVNGQRLHPERPPARDLEPGHGRAHVQVRRADVGGAGCRQVLIWLFPARGLVARRLLAKRKTSTRSSRPGFLRGFFLRQGSGKSTGGAARVQRRQGRPARKRLFGDFLQQHQADFRRRRRPAEIIALSAGDPERAQRAELFAVSTPSATTACSGPSQWR